MIPYRRMASWHEDPRHVAAWARLTAPLLDALTPPRRRALLAAGSVVAVVNGPLARAGAAGQWPSGSLPGAAGTVVALVAVAGLVALVWHAARRWSQLPLAVRRWPQVALHAVFWLLLVVAWLLPLPAAASAVLAGSVALLPYLLWRLGYLLKSAERGSLRGSFLGDHLFYVVPAFGGSSTPYGKGPDYLASCEARDRSALSRSQLAGLKLLVLAAVWSATRAVLDAVVHATGPLAAALPGVTLPRLDAILEGRATVPAAGAWLTLYLELFHSVLDLAVTGHVIVGVLRLTGFNVFRNTYKPLLAETVLDFWNRYYYYFKELLAQFFFLPAFASGRRLAPAVRLVVAVFAAAFAGNTYYHLIDQEQLLFAGDWSALATATGPRLVYSALLATGLAVSMWRAQRPGSRRAPRGGLRRVGAIFAVWTFFAIIQVWAVPAAAGLAPRTRFVAALVGLA